MTAVSSCLLTAKLREQTKMWWLAPIQVAFQESAAGTEALSEFGAQLAKAREVLLAAEGSSDSLITPGLKIPLGGATVMDVLEAANIHHKRGIPTNVKVAWSATDAECAEAGCMWKTVSSVLLHPIFTAELMTAVRAEMGTDHHVRPDDTMASLQARLGTALVFDDIHAAQGGHGRGGRTVPLNSTAMPQPRRSSQSVRGSPAYMGADGSMQVTLTTSQTPTRTIS
jgi:hypothetical protein